MATMLKDSLAHYPAVFAACIVLVTVATLFTLIGIWIFRAKSIPVFARASRLPLGEEE